MRSERLLFAFIERIRELSGTSAEGTTLLGLYQAAQELDLHAEGYQATIEQLRTLENPAILHVVKNNAALHFLVCYVYDEKKDTFLVSDPAERALKSIPSDELEQMWESHTLLLVKRTDQFQIAKKETIWQQLKWMYDFTRPDFNLLFTSLILGVFVSILGLSIAVFSQKLIDVILPERDVFRLYVGAGLLLFLLLSRLGMSYMRRLFLLRQNKDFNIRILQYFYHKLLRLPKPFFDNRKTGDLVARMNDTARIQRTIAVIFASVAIDFVMVLVSLTALLVYSPRIGGIALLWIPVFIWIVFRFKNKILAAQRKVMAAYAQNEGNYIDTIQGVGTIKVDGREPFFDKWTEQFYTAHKIARFDLGMIGLNFGMTTQLIGTFFTVGIILYGSVLVIEGLLTMGVVMAVIQLVSITMGSVAAIAGAYIGLQEARVALDRMKEFTDLKAEFEEEEEAEKAEVKSFERLQVNDLCFRFRGRPLLLKNVSFEVRKGEVVVIKGESGCGKSTLLQILQGFYQAESGDMLVNGKGIEVFSMLSWRKLLGVVPQQIKLFNASLVDNIVLDDMKTVDMAEMKAFMNDYGFDRYFSQFPAGYATILGESGVQISGGQQQLVALARALYHKPQLLLLDEPTSALDKYTETWVLQLLERLKKEMGIVIVSHRERPLQVADRVYSL